MLLWIILFGPTQAEELLISYFPLFQSFLTLLGETTRPTEWQPLWKTKYFCVICKAQLPFNNFTRQTRTPSSVCMLRNHITKIIKNSYRDIRLRSSASQPIVNCLLFFNAFHIFTVIPICCNYNKIYMLFHSYHHFQFYKINIPFLTLGYWRADIAEK